MKRIAISGSPCSGKSTLVDLLKRETWARDIMFIPELATMLINGGFPVDFHNELSRINFQRAVYHSQRHAEMGADKTFIVDRTLADGAAYVGGVETFKQRVGYDLGIYDLIIFLSPPPEEAYTLSNNTARRESYKEAVELASITRRVVKEAYGHKVIFIESDTFIGKMAKACELIRKCISE